MVHCELDDSIMQLGIDADSKGYVSVGRAHDVCGGSCAGGGMGGGCLVVVTAAPASVTTPMVGMHMMWVVGPAVQLVGDVSGHHTHNTAAVGHAAVRGVQVGRHNDATMGRV